MPTIDVLESELRDLINAPRRHHELYANEHKFSQLCSSLDVIGDTELALDAYLSPAEAADTTGECYLRTYGALQALVLQQDAVQHLAESLGVRYPLPTDVRDIREIRNNAVGHPTRRGNAPGNAFNHISRISLSSSGFEMMTFRPGSAPECTLVNVPQLIQTQRTALVAVLEIVVEHERQTETSHRQRFRDNPLASAFPTWLTHSLEQIREDVLGVGHGMGSEMLSTVEEAIVNFKNMLTARRELPALSDVVDHDANPAINAAQRLREFLGGNAFSLEREDAAAFLFRMEHAIHNLRELAIELDEKYANEPARRRSGA